MIDRLRLIANAKVAAHTYPGHDPEHFHEHRYLPLIRRLPGGFEWIGGWQCRCGDWRPVIAPAELDPLRNAIAALRVHRGPPWSLWHPRAPGRRTPV